MPNARRCGLLACLLVALPAVAHAGDAPLPAAVAAPNLVPIITLHAEGAQIYECRLDAEDRLMWAFREPIATLLSSGKTVGRHYVGPNWDYQDGSGVTAKAAGQAPGATPKDIPLLKLDVTTRHGNGLLADAVVVQRINTRGGKLEGACETLGVAQSAPYSADYVFLKKP